MKPFFCAGEDNIAPEITNGLKKFQKNGVSTPEYVYSAGVGNIRLKPDSEIRFSSGVTPESLYRVSFDFTFSAGSEFDYNADYPGLHGWISISDQKRKVVSSWQILEQRNSTSSMRYETCLYSTGAGKRIMFSLGYNGTKGCAMISNIKIIGIQISAEDDLFIITPPQGKSGNSFLEVRSNLQDEGWNIPSVPKKIIKTNATPQNSITVSNSAALRNVAVIFHRSDPDKLFFYSLPENNEIGRSIKVSLTADEVSVFALAVRPQQQLSALRLVQPILKDQSGRPFPGTANFGVVRYHPRRIDYYGRGQTWHWVADHFYEADGGIDAEIDRTQVFWVTVLSHPGVAAGSYTGKIKVYAADNILGEIPIEVVIRPFRLLDTSPKTRGIYQDSDRWDSFTDEQILKELADFKSHGINTMFIPSGRPVVNAGAITGWGLDKASERFLALIGSCQMDGPFVVSFEWLDDWLTDYFKIPATLLRKDPILWPQKVKDAYRKCLSLFKSEFERRGLDNVLFEAVDEPGYWKAGSPEQFIWKYSIAREVGLETYCTSSYLPDDPLGKNITHHCYSNSVLVNPDRTDFIRKDTMAAGQKFWWYGAGAYSGQIGNMVRNRYLSGFLFFKSKADGLMIWTFQRPVGDPFDDFYASELAQPCLTYPDPDNPEVNLYTPQWEGIRQGWNDYRYAATLAELAKTSKTAKADLDRILESMPWNGDVFSDGSVTNARCDEWREEIATAIEKYVR